MTLDCITGMKFLRNAWYVAGFAEEIAAGEMLARRKLDQLIALETAGQS